MDLDCEKSTMWQVHPVRVFMTLYQSSLFEYSEKGILRKYSEPTKLENSRLGSIESQFDS